MDSITQYNRQQTRINYLDIFRGFGIIFMVMGHIGFGSRFDFFIHAFHMPMFFWISGYLFKPQLKEEQSFKDFILKKAKSLILPYFVFGILHYFLYTLEQIISSRYIHVDKTPLLHLFSVNTTGLAICGALWFLTALFFTDVIFFLIDRYVSNEVLKLVIIVSVSLLGNTVKNLLPFTLPYALGASFVGIGLYYIGYMCKKYSEQKVIRLIMNLTWIPTVILGIAAVFLIFTNGYINMRTGTYAIIPLFWINAVLAIVVGFNFSRLICSYIENNCIGKWLINIGVNSIVYVCLNQVIIMFVNRFFDLLQLPEYISKSLVLTITLLILFLITIITMNSRLKMLFGKR